MILAGDFNTSLTAFDDMKALLADGWVDAALFDAERRGIRLEPTCKRAARHTFCVVSPLRSLLSGPQLWISMRIFPRMRSWSRSSNFRPPILVYISGLFRSLWTKWPSMRPNLSACPMRSVKPDDEVRLIGPWRADWPMRLSQIGPR